jgi:hypothetical protein
LKRTLAVAATAVAVTAVATGVALGYGHHSSTAQPASTVQPASTAKPASGYATTSSATQGSAPVPPSLRVPRGSHLVVSLHVLQGVQVYTCTAGSWVFQEPDADMSTVTSQRPTVLYTAGPEWVSTTDGSAVWGSPLKEVAEPGTIPDLLVKAVKTRGTGLFGHIDYIQRLGTSGGLAPSGHCTAGAITATPYRATEQFWAPNAS